MTMPFSTCRRFKSDRLEYVYRLYLEQKFTPGWSNALYTAYKRGLTGHYASGGGYDPKTLAYAAWCAGREVARLAVIAR